MFCGGGVLWLCVAVVSPDVRLLRVGWQEGVLGLWTPGMVASMLRELSYSSIRLGLYPAMKRFYGADAEGYVRRRIDYYSFTLVLWLMLEVGFDHPSLSMH